MSTPRPTTLVLSVLLLLAGTVTAQIDAIPLREAEAEERSVISGIQVNGIVDRPTIDMYGMCIGMTDSNHGYVDTDRDGYADTLRQFGAAMVDAETYQRLGVRVFNPIRNQATLRAQGDVVQTIEVLVAVDRGFSESFAMSQDFSAELDTDSYESVRAEAREVIRGATVSGTRLISLPDAGGVCVVVRYDVPLRLNALEGGRTVPLGTPSGDTGTRHDLPPAGVAGDF